MPVPTVVRRVGCLQTQYAPSAYIALWSRIEGFTRNQLTGSLGRRTVIQGTMMRATIHMVSRSDYPLLAAAIRRPRREWWLRTAATRRLGDVDYEQAAAVVRRELAGGPLRRETLIERLSVAGFPDGIWEGVGLWVDLVRVPPSGTWERRRADLFGLAEEWAGPIDVEEEDGLAVLVRRYLAGFGPAGAKDIASWSGVPVTTLWPIIESLPLRRFRSESGETLFDVRGGSLPDPATEAPVRFLPTWETALLAHARRTGILAEEHRAALFSTRNPQSTPSFLVDGEVAGTWRHKEGKVTVEPFHPLPRVARRHLEREADRLQAWLG